MVIKTLMIRIQSIRFIAVEMDREDNNTSKTNRLIVDIDDYNKMMIWILDLNNIMIPFRILVNILVFMVWFKKRQRQAFMYHIIPL